MNSDIHVKELSCSRKRSLSNDDNASITCVNHEICHNTKRRRTHGPEDSETETKRKAMGLWDLCLVDETKKVSSITSAKRKRKRKNLYLRSSPVIEDKDDELDPKHILRLYIKLEKVRDMYKERCRKYEISNLKLRDDLLAATREIKSLRQRTYNKQSYR